MEIRLQKALADAGVASRRSAEELIRLGRVTVNGRVSTEMGRKVDPELDHIKVDGRHLKPAAPKVYLILNKPKGVLTTLQGPEEDDRPTIEQFLRGVRHRVFPVGRLDYDTEGLLLLPIELSPNLRGLERPAHRALNVEDRRVVLPSKEDTYGSIEGLMNHFMLVMDGYGIRPPKGEAYFPVEGANGELGFYIVSDGSDRPYRVRCRPPCFPPMAALHLMIEGEMVADVVPTFGSVNMIGGELDR